jgi:hypothetical protein
MKQPVAHRINRVQLANQLPRMGGDAYGPLDGAAELLLF